MGQKIAWVLSVALLLCSGALGVYNGINERDAAHTLVQKSVRYLEKTKKGRTLSSPAFSEVLMPPRWRTKVPVRS
ncbi:MAG: hypothetical protein QOD47_2701 [Gemmatimonadaceae bacterium]|jgi:hypothetical protein|nr:hypothetical protein [Gemmatimonadaceae bacterium]